MIGRLREDEHRPRATSTNIRSTGAFQSSHVSGRTKPTTRSPDNQQTAERESWIEHSKWTDTVDTDANGVQFSPQSISFFSPLRTASASWNSRNPGWLHSTWSEKPKPRLVALRGNASGAFGGSARCWRLASRIRLKCDIPRRLSPPDF